LQDVSKSFYDLFVPAVDRVTLSFKKGDFCILIGLNGSGKSTLLKIISGDYKADSGAVVVKGKIAQVSQDINVGSLTEMTLLENIILGWNEKPKFSFYYKRCKERVIGKVKELGLEKYVNRPLKTFSDGQRQMIATLMAIISGCDILLLDEHTSSLDPKMQVLLMEYTSKKIQNNGLTAVMITHKLENAVQYGNRLIMLYQGKVVVDIAGKKKKSLKESDLFELFRRCEDRACRDGGL